MQRSQDCDKVLRSLRVKEHYIIDHRKHIDQQVSVDASLQKLENLRLELLQYFEDWELFHMRYELLVSDEELTHRRLY